MLAIIERYGNAENGNSFDDRFWLHTSFTGIFDELGVLLFPISSETALSKVCDLCDGLLVTGYSCNIFPEYYGKEPMQGEVIDRTVDVYKFDKKVIDAFYRAKKPILGICGGLQSINVAFGGTLCQRIEGHNGEEIFHKIKVEKGSFLFDTYKSDEVKVNTFHRQCAEKVAEGFSVTAVSEDGITEAIEMGNIVGVQWHPEIMRDMKFFKNFAEKFGIKKD